MSAKIRIGNLKSVAFGATGVSMISLSACLGLRFGIDMGVEGQFAATPLFLVGIALGADGIRRFFTSESMVAPAEGEKEAAGILRVARAEMGLKDGESLIDAIRVMKSSGTGECHATN